MAVYVGLRAIAKRMGWKSPQTVLRQYQSHGFPLVPRPLKNGQYCWITDDMLILEWLKQRVSTPSVGRVPRRHYETCYRCGATILAPGQSRYARTSRTIQRITSSKD